MCTDFLKLVYPDELEILHVRFVGIHGNLGLLMLHEHVGTLYFTDHFRVVMVAQARNSLT